MSRTCGDPKVESPISREIGEWAGRWLDLAMRSSVGHRLAIRAVTVGMTILFGSAVLGLVGLGHNSTRIDPPLDVDDGRDGGTVVRWEVVHLWVPESLQQLADRQSGHEAVRSHEELRRLLERCHQQRLRYAVTSRSHQVDGDHADITFIRHPYEDWPHFQEFLDVLARLNGARQSRGIVADIAVASVHILPEATFDLEPADLYSELQKSIRRQGWFRMNNEQRTSVIEEIGGGFGAGPACHRLSKASIAFSAVL